MTSLANRILYLVRHGEPAPEGEPLTEVGERQARLVAERLRGVPFAAIHHSPVARAAQTAELIAAAFPGVPRHPSELLRECVPAVPERAPQYAAYFDSIPAEQLAAGPTQAAAAIERFAGPTGAGRHELIVSHGNLINWFVCHALQAPPQAWLSMLDYHCAITVIMYFPDRVKLVSYNDMGHLPATLRGTDYPDEARV
jgi:serine/threonine-protein phosphatase PGAM5